MKERRGGEGRGGGRTGRRSCLAKEEERRTMGSAEEGMKCEGGFFATVSSGDAVKNSEQISRWGGGYQQVGYC